MKASELKLKDILHSGDQFVIPVFQRYYVWEKKNWDKLWSDIELLMLSTSTFKPHFLGTIVFVPKEKQPGSIAPFIVIDGQQRLITLSLILCALRDQAILNEWDLKAKEIEENYLIHKYKTGREHYKVYPRLRDRDIYIGLLEKSESSLESQILNAYSYFKDRIESSKYAESKENLSNFFDRIIDGLELISITLSGEDPYKIFKSLNYDGVKLNQSDLIRNHVFMGVNIDEQDEFDDKHWSPFESYFHKESRNKDDLIRKIDQNKIDQFFRNFLMKNGQTVLQEYIYEEFDKWYSSIDKNPFEAIKEIQINLEYQMYIENKKNHSSTRIQEAINRIGEYSLKTPYPLIFKLLSYYDDEIIGERDLTNALNYIDSFLMRRYVCEKNTRQYIDWFVELCGKMDDDPVNNLHTYLTDKGWPEDREFIAAISNVEIYKKKIKSIFFSRIEEYLQNPSEKVNLEKCEIEHVMPQTINPENEDGRSWISMLGTDWEETHGKILHTAGNLTLVGADYNKAMQNKRFIIKKNSLQQSKVYMNQYFSQDGLDKWSVDEILSRSSNLANYACKIWPRPLF